MEAAVEDGVDVLSLSLGSEPSPFYSDPVALGGFNAINKGIFVSCAAGNSKPSHNTVSNDAPWLLMVAASSMDGLFVATVKIGNGEEFEGESIYQPADFQSKMLALIYPGFINGLLETYHCTNGSLKNIDVRGKLVLCDHGGNIGIVKKGGIIKEAGDAGMILINAPKEGYSTLANVHALPASHIPYAYG
ncbi:subtilisin-like protease SBT1.2 [Canna indica]|uniref:Subtilisin-like protease SBT1.2 n=1 Tax=Canna indica TaxID=4628 RepID=A0AAQ3KKW6_9LILI|nr:subtilisin-like protease SBT1.2 [Canna indica]